MGNYFQTLHSIMECVEPKLVSSGFHKSNVECGLNV